ncbi:MAG: hypothetical protein B7Y80_17895 [Hyphomicrobium sp. 32-62-53]|nr:MAG: hypothetical protein B7Z29_17790 [Hyphomicrobium sp. 12-62-95]OYX97903.1 MAG: hypothetical protein B7Y80_17895 [Hyphomicrobium sp. 32-62-53]
MQVRKDGREKMAAVMRTAIGPHKVFRASMIIARIAANAVNTMAPSPMQRSGYCRRQRTEPAKNS